HRDHALHGFLAIPGHAGPADFLKLLLKSWIAEARGEIRTPAQRELTHRIVAQVVPGDGSGCDTDAVITFDVVDVNHPVTFMESQHDQLADLCRDLLQRAAITAAELGVTVWRSAPVAELLGHFPQAPIARHQ